MAKVVWSTQASSGLAFYEPLRHDLVVSVRREHDMGHSADHVLNAAREWATGEMRP